MASCLDVSTDQDPKTDCLCQLGRVMNDFKDGCIIPPPTTPTPRPDPTLPADVKMATTAVYIPSSLYLYFIINQY